MLKKTPIENSKRGHGGCNIKDDILVGRKTGVFLRDLGGIYIKKTTSVLVSTGVS